MFLAATTPPPGPGSTPPPGLSHHVYLPLVSQCYLRVNGQPAQITKYYFLNGQRLAQRKGCAGTIVYFYRDHLGSTAATSAGDATRYWPFGSVRSGGLTTTAYRFTGQLYDPSAGLYFYKARFYDPVIGRFLQPDTIVPDPYNPQALNRYAYCRNNPLRYSDPSGNTPWDVVDVAFFLWSAKDFVQNPSWANAGWMAADALSLLPVIPSTGWVRRGAKLLFQADNAADTAGLIRKFTTRAVGEAAGQFVERVGREAEEIVAREGLEGGLETAGKAAASGDEILPGLFKYGSDPIAGYQQHHLWPEALGGPHEGWSVFARSPHYTRDAIQGRLNAFLRDKVGKGQRELEQWARENPDQILDYLRDFYKNENIPFPY